MNAPKPDLSPFRLRARSFLSQGRVDDAMGLFDDVIAVDPQDAAAYADRGTAFAMQKQFDLAMLDLDRAFALGYGDASAYSTAGTIALETRQYEKALGYFAKAVELDPAYPFTYFNRANVYYALGKREAAIADLNTCLSFDSAADFRQLVAKRLAAIQNG